MLICLHGRRRVDVLHVNFETLEKHKLYSKVIDHESDLRTLSVVIQGDFLTLLCIATDDHQSKSYLLVIANFITDEIVYTKLPQAVQVSKQLLMTTDNA